MILSISSVTKKSMYVCTDYGRPERKQPSLHGRKFNPNAKFLAEAYFVCHIGPIFQISLIYALIGCPQSVLQTKLENEVKLNFTNTKYVSDSYAIQGLQTQSHPKNQVDNANNFWFLARLTFLIPIQSNSNFMQVRDLIQYL